MKKIAAALFAALVGLTTATAYAAEKGTPKGWMDDYAAAMKQAVKLDRPVLMLFTGSDWCPYCVKLHNEVLSKNSFKKFAEKELVLLYVDFPFKTPISDEQRRKNDELQKKFGIEEFPTTLLLTGKGRKLAAISGYPPDYLKMLKAALPKKK